MDKKKIILVVGRSGSGKDTLVNEMAERHKLNILCSYTTRPKREFEGNTHIFINEKDFSKYKNNIIAYTEISGYKYFSTYDQLDTTDFYIIDPNGVKYLKEKLSNSNYDLKVINIYLPYEIRKHRAVDIRGDDEDIFELRNKSENLQFTEFEKQHEYDYKIINESLDKSIIDFENILKKEAIL